MARKISSPPRPRGSAGRKPAPEPVAPRLPTREEILAFVARERRSAEAAGAAPGKIGKREIAREFGIKGADRIDLKRILRELEGEGALEREGKHLHRPGMLPSVVVADITSRDADGDFIALPDEWDVIEHGPAPRILVHIPMKPRPGTPVPGLGDRVLLRVEPNRDDRHGAPAFLGRVTRVLSKGKSQILGVFRADPQGGGRLLPVDKKSLGREVYIEPGDIGPAQDGDLVAAELHARRRNAMPTAIIKERLGSPGTEKAVSLIALHAHGIPNVFPATVLEDAARVQPAGLSGREDWRDLLLVTIDPPDAKDHDDAVHAASDPDPANPGGFVLTVAIADVAAYVRPGRPLDREALERGNSVYFPDRVVPMLPERISNDLCSLRPKEDRPALAVRMIVDARGRKTSHTFHRIMMRSAAKLAYAQAQAAIDGGPDDATSPLLEPVLRPLWAAYAALKIERETRSPLDLDLPERRLVLTPDGRVDRVVTPLRLDAHRLIEEFMILANVAAAETLEAHRQPLIYRVHDEPTMEKLNGLAEFLASIGIKFAKGQVMRPSHFNGLLHRVAKTENEHLVNEVVLRSQAQAEYASENYGHFGLNLQRYAHFTSPIRRYADLIVHRALIRALKLGPDGLPDMTIGDLADIAARISVAERRAMAAERETTDRLIAIWLSDRIGASFTGRIAGVTRAGLFVKLEETGADGFVPAATLGQDYYRFEEGQRALIGSRSGETFRLGDLVDVKLVEAAPFAGALRFEMLGQHGGKARTTRAAEPFRKGPRRDTKPTGRKGKTGASASANRAKGPKRR